MHSRPRSCRLNSEYASGDALAVGDQHALRALAKFPLHDRTVVVEHVVQQSRAAGHRAKFRLKPDQPARRDHVVEAHAAAAVGLHVLQLGAAAAERRT